ncbi:MAG: tRNA pseudouridine(55) synthase TruB [Ignavibacteriaceae bacterium]
MITKRTKDLSEIDFSSGQSVLIDKESGWTSFDVVRKIRNTVGLKKVGHAGTLDPLATGLLILCTGKNTKKIQQFQNLRKTYCGTILLGKTSDSFDLATELKPGNANILPEREEILKAIESLTGEIEQIPPVYSALKKNGQRLYKLAREGKTIELQPRKVLIYNFSLLGLDYPELNFEITCSKGTYIRSVANDLGRILGCGAVLSSLRRTAIGQFRVDDAFKVDEFSQLVHKFR